MCALSDMTLTRDKVRESHLSLVCMYSARQRCRLERVGRPGLHGYSYIISAIMSCIMQPVMRFSGSEKREGDE